MEYPQYIVVKTEHKIRIVIAIAISYRYENMSKITCAAEFESRNRVVMSLLSTIPGSVRFVTSMKSETERRLLIRGQSRGPRRD